MDTIVIRLRLFLILMVVILLMATVGFMYAEDLSLIDAVYFSLVTITTVGYGDIHPTSLMGKILAIVLILGGVGTFTGIVANATELLLSRREKETRRQKLHLVIGLFFSELGLTLLHRFAELDPDIPLLRREIGYEQEWTDHRVRQAEDKLTKHSFRISPEPDDLIDIRELLKLHGTLLLRLLEHPALLEHEQFTSLLRAVFHLREELLQRKSLKESPQSDIDHLSGDISRVYVQLTMQWIEYMKHLKESFPYLFSLASRRNPFVDESGVEV